MEVVYAPVPMQESNGVITAYFITYYVNDRARGCQNPVTMAVPANVTLAIIQGLDPTQEFCVTVAARTSVGLGNPSQLETVGCKCCSVICVLTMCINLSPFVQCFHPLLFKFSGYKDHSVPGHW